MAKDSTAVQRLIELAQQKPIDVDLGGLFDGEPPRRAAAPPLPRPASMQPTSAPPPLPRRPSGTQTALAAIPAGTPAPERIERFEPADVDAPADLAAADELFGNKPLPPLPQARSAAPPPPTSLPPPRRSVQQPVAALSPPVEAIGMAPLPRSPVVADELPTSPVTLTEPEGATELDWFQQSEAVPMVDEFGTQSVQKSRGSAVVAIAAAFGLGLVVAGGYIVYGRLSTTAPKPVPATSVASRINAAAGAAAKAAPIAAPAVAAAAPAPVQAAPAPVEVAPSPAPVQAAPAAAAPPTVTPIEPAAEAAAPTPAAAAPVAGALVDVTLKSDPSGVTVMLIDGGGAVKLGKTPTVASLSAGTQHQILFSRDGYSATMATIDPAAQTDVMVALAPTPGSHAQPAVAVVQPAPTQSAPVATPIETAPAPAPKHPHAVAAPAPRHTESAPKHADAAPKHSEPAAPQVAHVSHQQQVDDADDNPISGARKPAPKRTATATETSGVGTLMIGAKPPCDIVIDGRATGLTTPQRSINLPPGSHSITLVNRANNIKKSFSVSINSGTSTKVVKDFTSLMKN